MQVPSRKWLDIVLDGPPGPLGPRITLANEAAQSFFAASTSTASEAETSSGDGTRISDGQALDVDVETRKRKLQTDEPDASAPSVKRPRVFGPLTYIPGHGEGESPPYDLAFFDAPISRALLRKYSHEIQRLFLAYKLADP